MIWVSVMLFLSSCVVANFLFFSHAWVVEWEILSSLGASLSMVFIFDFFSFFFSWVVLIISSMIFFFGQYYMDGDKFQKGFSLLLLGFVSSMILLIFSPNLFSLLLGWDGLGLVSYLLVVYYMSYSSANAGMLTILMNRVGDVFFLFSISLLASVFVWDYFVLKTEMTFLISILLVFTFITKSAQVPFSSWLPAAMAAPTPVSSLVHSSTLVTAGIFLLIRFNHVILPFSRVLLVISLCTLLMAGVMANFEWDMKKLIAFSTLSQLGFMTLSLSAGLVLFCFFHLLCHALFKATLFMTSGAVIHNSNDSQDFRNSFSFVKMTPMVASTVIVCVLCLCGFPFLTGFFSKDFIVDSVSFSLLFFLVFLLAVVLTISYSLRFSFYVLGAVFSLRMKILQVYDTVFFLFVPTWVLISLSIFLGLFWADLLAGLYLFFSFFGGLWKFSYLMLLVFMGIISYSFFFLLNSLFHLNKYFFSTMWFLSRIFGFRVGSGFLMLSSSFLKNLDQGWMEYSGPQGLSSTLSFTSSYMFREQSISFFLYFVLFSLLVFLMSW